MLGMSSGGEPERSAGWAALRISDSDRDQISGVLSEHAAEGRLTMDELDQRLGVLYAAQTRAQAAAIVADLPALAGPRTPGRPHVANEHDEAAPTLPEWLTFDRVDDSAPAEPRSSAGTAGTSVPVPVPAREDRAAMRKRAKLRQDENAIGHTFQSTRRAINAELASARASGKSAEVQCFEGRLREAQQTADSARQAVAVGDRAEVQRLLAQLRTLG
jgi:hypothetical protein